MSFRILRKRLRAAVEVVEDDEQEEEKNPFSGPWEDSDLIFLVEDEKFHVHRQILSIHSPVFKAMLNSQFKEATAKEIPLPGKKANEVLDFLKQLYLKEKCGVTMKNVEHILKLADEYQVKGVLSLCIKCLEEEAKDESNAVKILYLANHSVIAREDGRLEKVRQDCYKCIGDMELQHILWGDHFEDLDKQTMKTVLTKRAQRVERFLRKIYPQLIALVEYCLWLCHQKKRADMQWCPIHYVAGVSKEDTCERMTQCSACRKMMASMIAQTCNTTEAGRQYCYGGKSHLDKTLVQIIQDFKKIMNIDQNILW